MKRLLVERTDMNQLHDMGLLIVCGGQSTRMGRDKAIVALARRHTFDLAHDQGEVLCFFTYRYRR